VSDIVKKNDFLNHSRFNESRERGEVFHGYIDEYWKTGIRPINTGKYQPWIDSFLSQKNLNTWGAIASELRLVDRFYDIAGSIDLILKNYKTGRVALCDYKTKKENFSKSNHRVQMGGYLSLLHSNYPAFHVDTVRIFWVTNKRTTSSEYDVLECVRQYEQARNDFFAKSLPW
tara:strand:- start:729 stop:1247 length:519 start_codon:yes stop_codon:yes gene_type:complete